MIRSKHPRYKKPIRFSTQVEASFDQKRPVFPPFSTSNKHCNSLSQETPDLTPEEQELISQPNPTASNYLPMDNRYYLEKFMTLDSSLYRNQKRMMNFSVQNRTRFRVGKGSQGKSLINHRVLTKLEKISTRFDDDGFKQVKGRSFDVNSKRQEYQLNSPIKSQYLDTAKQKFSNIEDQLYRSPFVFIIKPEEGTGPNQILRSLPETPSIRDSMKSVDELKEQKRSEETKSMFLKNIERRRRKSQSNRQILEKGLEIRYKFSSFHIIKQKPIANCQNQLGKPDPMIPSPWENNDPIEF